MTKTAEEILKECRSNCYPDALSVPEPAIFAMRQFAAQEVEAYRKRLRRAIKDSGLWSEMKVLDIIDAVK